LKSKSRQAKEKLSLEHQQIGILAKITKQLASWDTPKKVKTVVHGKNILLVYLC